MHVNPSDLVPIKEAGRTLSRLVVELRRGGPDDRREVVVTRSGRPVAVLVTVERYGMLAQIERGARGDHPA